MNAPSGLLAGTRCRIRGWAQPSAQSLGKAATTGTSLFGRPDILSGARPRTTGPPPHVGFTRCPVRHTNGPGRSLFRSPGAAGLIAAPPLWPRSAFPSVNQSTAREVERRVASRRPRRQHPPQRTRRRVEAACAAVRLRTAEGPSHRATRPRKPRRVNRLQGSPPRRVNALSACSSGPSRTTSGVAGSFRASSRRRTNPAGIWMSRRRSAIVRSPIAARPWPPRRPPPLAIPRGRRSCAARGGLASRSRDASRLPRPAGGSDRRPRARSYVEGPRRSVPRRARGR